MTPLSEKIESFWPKKLIQFWPNKLSHLSWVETKTFKLKKKNIYCIGYPTGNRQSIIAKAVNKQNTSRLLLYKLYFKMISKMISKSKNFQCDFDFQITTSKMILILNHLYLRDLISILKSIYDDFAHLCMNRIASFYQRKIWDWLIKIFRITFCNEHWIISHFERVAV